MTENSWKWVQWPMKMLVKCKFYFQHSLVPFLNKQNENFLRWQLKKKESFYKNFSPSNSILRKLSWQLQWNESSIRISARISFLKLPKWNFLFQTREWLLSKCLFLNDFISLLQHFCSQQQREMREFSSLPSFDCIFLLIFWILF